jgi:hypothetical protein
MEKFITNIKVILSKWDYFKKYFYIILSILFALALIIVLTRILNQEEASSDVSVSETQNLANLAKQQQESSNLKIVKIGEGSYELLLENVGVEFSKIEITLKPFPLLEISFNEDPLLKLIVREDASSYKLEFINAQVESETVLLASDERGRIVLGQVYADKLIENISFEITTGKIYFKDGSENVITPVVFTL